MLNEDHPSCVKARKDLATVTDEAARLPALYQQRADARQVVARTLGAVTTWLQNLPLGTLEDVAPPVVTLSKGEDLLAAIKRYRAQADDLTVGRASKRYSARR